VDTNALSNNMKNLLLLSFCLFAKILIAQDQKIFLLTDRENYAPGDTIWIHAKLINSKDRTYSKTNDILYLTVDGQKKSKQTISQFKNGICNSQIVIPRTFGSGVFSFQARIKYLEQFGPKSYFTKKIKVSLPGVPSPLPTVALKASSNHLTFYPEGGSYLPDFSAKIGYKIALPLAEYKGKKGIITDSHGSQVASFYPDLNGIGHVSFMPKTAETYIAIFAAKTKKHEVALPALLTSGLSLSVDNVLTRSLVTITVNNASNVPDTAYVVVYKNDSLVFKNMIYTENQQYKLSINQDNFDQEGLAQVLLVNAKNETLAERWVYISKENNYAIEKEIVNETAGTLISEKLILSLKDQNDTPMAGVPLAIKISKAEKDIDNNKSLKAYLNFGSEISGMTAKIDTFFELSPTAAAFNLDNVLLANKPDVKVKSKFTQHEEYFNLKAKVFKNGIKVPNSAVKLFIKDKYTVNSYDVSSDDSSMINLSGNWFDSLTVFATDANFSPLELGIEKNDFVPNKPKVQPKKPVQKTTSTPATPEIAILKTDTRRKMYAGKTDFSIKPKNIKDTGSIVLNWLEMKLKNSKLDTLSNFNLKETLDAYTTYFYLDGNYVHKNVLSLINQKDIAQVDVLYKTDKMMNFGKKEGAVLNILSKSRKARDNAIAIQNTIKWLAFEHQASFKNRNRTVSGQSTILWAPDQVTDKEGKISFKLFPYNKLLSYVITVQGIDKNGNVIETEIPLKP
jgi:hypothetical protein